MFRLEDKKPGGTVGEVKIEDCENINTSPIGFLESITLRLIEQKIFDIKIWTKFLNSISLLDDNELQSGIRYSLEVLYLENIYEKYLLDNLNDKLKNEFNEWTKYYKD